MAELLGNHITGRSHALRQKRVDDTHFGQDYQTANDLITVDPAQNDTLFLMELYSSAVLSDVISRLQWTGMGAGVTVDVGFANDTRRVVKAATDNGAGLVSQGDALVDGLDTANAGSGTLVSGVALADRFKQLWELAGLDRDPKVMLKIQMTFLGANPASCTIAFEQGWLTGG